MQPSLSKCRPELAHCLDDVGNASCILSFNQPGMAVTSLRCYRPPFIPLLSPNANIPIMQQIEDPQIRFHAHSYNAINVPFPPSNITPFLISYAHLRTFPFILPYHHYTILLHVTCIGYLCLP